MFYNDFAKKVENSNEKGEGRYKFTLNGYKRFIFLGYALVFSLIGTLQLYINVKEDRNPLVMIFPVLVLLMAAHFIRNAFKYKLILDLEEETVTFGNEMIDLSKVTRGDLTLKKLPKQKKRVPCVTLVTSEGLEACIPLIMGKKLLFTKLIKGFVGREFKVIEDQ